jgi:hypothetical protein
MFHIASSDHGAIGVNTTLCTDKSWHFDISGQTGCMGISARTVFQTYEILLPSTLYEVIPVCSYPLPVLKMQQSRSSEI